MRVARRDFDRARRVPGDLAAEIERASSEGQTIWQAARAAADFAAFAPALRRNVELAREYAACFDDFARPYDALLADYDFGLTAARLQEVFGELSEQLAPLVAEARGRRRPRPARPWTRSGVAVPVVLARIGADDDGWRIDESAHPFSVGVGRSDSRVTTRYDEADLLSVIAAMHEFGHALYERQIAPGARAHQPRRRHLDVDARVPEQAVGEPRRPPPGVRRGARGGVRGRRPRRRAGGAARRR